MGEKRTYKLTINGCFVCIKKGISTSFVCWQGLQVEDLGYGKNWFPPNVIVVVKLGNWGAGGLFSYIRVHTL